MASPMEPKPGSDARGPVCPKPDTCTSTMPGFAAASASYVIPQRASVPGRKFSSTTSQPAGDAPRRFLPARFTQIDRDRALVASDRRPPQAATVDPHAVAPHDVTDFGRLDLDDLGAEVTQHLARERPRDERAELQDACSRERRASRLVCSSRAAQ